MEVISVIVMFLFGNMNDTENRMTQYIPMENLSSCLKEKRILANNAYLMSFRKGAKRRCLRPQLGEARRDVPLLEEVRRRETRAANDLLHGLHGDLGGLRLHRCRRVRRRGFHRCGARTRRGECA